MRIFQTSQSAWALCAFPAAFLKSEVWTRTQRPSTTPCPRNQDDSLSSYLHNPAFSGKRTRLIAPRSSGNQGLSRGLQPVVIYHLRELSSSTALAGHFSLQMNWDRWSVREGQLEYAQQGVGGIVTNNIFKPYALAAVQKVKKILSAFSKALFSLLHFLHFSQKSIFFLNPVSF